MHFGKGIEILMSATSIVVQFPFNEAEIRTHINPIANRREREIRPKTLIFSAKRGCIFLNDDVNMIK